MTTTLDPDLAAIQRRCQRDPVWKAEHLFGFRPWSKQAEIMRAVRDHPKVAVRSCHGVGKTAVAAFVVLDFLSEHPGSRVVTTAPTWHQVKDLLWREIRKLHGRTMLTELPFGGRISATQLELADDWFALGLSTDEPERFSGHHAPHLLFVVDEASGVDEAIYEAGEGFQTTDGARMLMIGNPTKVTGQFHKAFTSEKAAWHTISISAFESPNLTGEAVSPDAARALVGREWVAEREARWGSGSPAYQARVLGEFPTTADDAVISLGSIERAQALTLEPGLPVEIGCDVARFGSDETVIAVRRGNQCRIQQVYHGKDTMQTAGVLVSLARSIHATRLVVDDAGLGGGVTDRLRETLPRSVRLDPFNASTTPKADPEDYPNRRSEAWFALSDRMAELDLDEDEQLLADLAAPLYKLNSKGQRVVEEKAVTRKRLGRSPDRADAVVMLFAPHPSGRMRVARPHGLVTS